MRNHNPTKRRRHTGGEGPLMEIEILDKSRMAILLLEQCNFECPHCLRVDEPMYPGYQLSFEQLQTCLSDCRALESITWFHFTGGEPTLWTEGDRQLIDLLLEVCNTGFIPSFTSNGSSFVDYDKCCDFFKRYVDNSTTRLIVYLSIDTFHRNFNVEKGRAQSVDSVARFRRNLPPEKADLLDIRIVVTVSKDPESLLPDEMVRHYESLGMSFRFVPLSPKGRARQQLAHSCPDLDSDEPKDLGAYQRFYQKQGCKQSEPDETTRQERATALALIGDDYYFHIPVNDSEFPDKWRKVARLGHLPDAIIRAYAGATGTT